MSLSQQSIVAITGAGSGIGRALTIRLSKEPIAGIAIADKNEKGLNETLALIGDDAVEVMTSVVDVSKLEDVQRFESEILEKFSTVTHLINNAGVGMVGRVEQLSFNDIEWMMDINFWGTVYGTKVFLPIFRQQGFGHIVNISSVFGLISPPGQSAYCASKFAVRGFTEVLRHELEDSDIFVSCVHPGGIKTDIVKNARRGELATDEDMELAPIMLEKLALTTPDKAAEKIIKGIKTKNPRILIGRDAAQISLVQRLFPKRYFGLLDRLTGGFLSKYK